MLSKVGFFRLINEDFIKVHPQSRSVHTSLYASSYSSGQFSAFPLSSHCAPPSACHLDSLSFQIHNCYISVFHLTRFYPSPSPPPFLAFEFLHFLSRATRPISHRVGRSVCPSVHPSVHRSVTLCFFFLHFWAFYG